MVRSLLTALALVVGASVSAQPSAADVQSAGAAVNCSEATAIALGESVTSTLSPSSCEYVDGTEADFYVFRLDADASVTITQASDDFDSYLGLYEGNGLILESDDDSAGGPTGFDSRITMALPAGLYLAAVNSIGPGTGEYTLTVSVD